MPGHWKAVQDHQILDLVQRENKTRAPVAAAVGAAAAGRGVGRGGGVGTEDGSGGDEAGQDSGKAKAKAVSAYRELGYSFPLAPRATWKSECHCCSARDALLQELEPAGGAAEDLKVTRITPRHVQRAIRVEERLDSLIKATIAGDGVIPHIRNSLIQGQQRTA
eukprot:bmy_16905T0